MMKTKKPSKPVKAKKPIKKAPLTKDQINGKKGGRPKGVSVKEMEGVIADLKKLDLTPFKDIIADEVKKGRTSKMTQRTIWKLYESLRLGVPVKKACKWAGISRESYYKWKEKNPIFLDIMTEAENFASVLCRFTVLKQVKGGDGKLALKWLALKENAEFNNKTIIEREDEDEENTTGIWTAEEIEQIKEALGDDYTILDDKDDD